MVDSVTTMGCSRSTATKKPLNAPAAMPMAMPAAVSASGEADAPPASPSASATLTSEITAPADRSKPPVRITSVAPMAAIASVAPPLARKDRSK